MWRRVKPQMPHDDITLWHLHTYASSMHQMSYDYFMYIEYENAYAYFWIIFFRLHEALHEISELIIKQMLSSIENEMGFNIRFIIQDFHVLSVLK